MRTGIEKEEKPQIAKTLSLAEKQALEQKGRDTVADALVYLTSVRVGNFYARVINLMDRIAVPGFGTMGVSVQNGKYIFVYDPLFAARVSFEEICATCEHEVLHLILEHIPRYVQQRKIMELEGDKKLMDMSSNLAMDLAANELLAQSWPKIKESNRPLGYWVIPEEFKPPLPPGMSYEEYQHLLVNTLSKRLKSSPDKLYDLAQQVLQAQSDALQKALGQQPSPSPGQGQEQGQEPGAGQGQGQPQDGQGNGQGDSNNQGQPSPGQGGQGGKPGPTPEDLEQLQNEIDKLDPLDKKVLEMLIKSQKPHLPWQHGTGDEAESHKLNEHGKQLIKQTLSSQDKSRGTLPGHIMELIRKMLTPPSVPWTAFLHDIVQRTRQTKKSRGMSRPSKKLSAMKVYAVRKEEEGDLRFQRLAHIKQMPVFPGIKHDNKFTIVYLLDTSGSMGRDELQRGLSELQHIQKSDSDVRICVIYIDTNIGKEYWITPTDEIDEELCGRGGTDFEPGFVHVQEMCRKQDDAPDILVYCTDGYAPPPETKLPIPCVWLITPRGRPVMEEAGHITIEMKDYQLEDGDV